MAVNYPNMSNINLRELHAATSSSEDAIEQCRLHILSATATTCVVSVRFYDSQ